VISTRCDKIIEGEEDLDLTDVLDDEFFRSRKYKTPIAE
jgi:hypothetical protein